MQTWKQIFGKRGQIKSCQWVALASSAWLTFAIPLPAQDTAPKHHVYKLLASGTFGGPSSGITVVGGGAFGHILNSHGATIGFAETNIADPYKPHCFFGDPTGCYLSQALKLKDGWLTDLGALPGGSSASYALNDHGLVVGVSETGANDPLTNLPAYHAVIWRDGALSDLGTLGGSLSQAIDVNNLGQVVGVAANAIPDKYSGGLGPCITWFGCRTVATQQRAFLWEGGAMKDLGTLGGNDAIAYLINQKGQIAGVSFTNNTPNSTTGVPTQDPFLWDGGNMIDLGGLGGTYSTAFWLNSRGQVVGLSYLAGDKAYHGFSWEGGVMSDVGTLGGPVSRAYSVNDKGNVVGYSLLSDGQTAHAFLWHNNRGMTDLGIAPGYLDSVAYGINAGGQVVGLIATGPPGPTTTVNAALWEKSGGPVDLNQLLVSPSTLHLVQAYAINDKGEILAFGITPTGTQLIVELAPDGYCDSNCEARITASDKAAEIDARIGHGVEPSTRQSPVSDKSGRWRGALLDPLQLVRQ